MAAARFENSDHRTSKELVMSVCLDALPATEPESTNEAKGTKFEFIPVYEVAQLLANVANTSKAVVAVTVNRSGTSYEVTTANRSLRISTTGAVQKGSDIKFTMKAITMKNIHRCFEGPVSAALVERTFTLKQNKLELNLEVAPSAPTPSHPEASGGQDADANVSSGFPVSGEALASGLDACLPFAVYDPKAVRTNGVQFYGSRIVAGDGSVVCVVVELANIDLPIEFGLSSPDASLMRGALGYFPKALVLRVVGTHVELEGEGHYLRLPITETHLQKPDALLATIPAETASLDLRELRRQQIINRCLLRAREGRFGAGKLTIGYGRDGAESMTLHGLNPNNFNKSSAVVPASGEQPIQPWTFIVDLHAFNSVYIMSDGSSAQVGPTSANRALYLGEKTETISAHVFFGRA